MNAPALPPLGARVRPADSELPPRRARELADANLAVWLAAQKADDAMRNLTAALVRLDECAEDGEYIMIPSTTGPHLSVRDMADNCGVWAEEVAAIYAALDDSTARVMK